jgi:beta-lactamase regulating signal transducer with metallopeptidase domain
MSISSALLILAIVVIRSLTIHKLPKRTFLALWSMVLVRLLIPFSISLNFNVYMAVDRIEELFKGAADTQITKSLINALPDTYAIGASASPAQPDSTSPIWFVWVVGIVACVLFFLVIHLRCLREYKAALPVENDYINEWLQQHKIWRPIRIKQSDRINAPMTYGIWKPVILFPKTTDWQDETALRYILTHELTHIKRFDILSKWLLAAALCVHWANPLVWAMYVLANRDIELSCDEKVVRTFGETTKSAYALALIGLEENRFSHMCSSFAKNATEERINAIMKIKRTTLTGLLSAFVLIAGITAGTLAVSAATQQNNADSGETVQGTDLNGDVGITPAQDESSDREIPSFAFENDDAANGNAVLPDDEPADDTVENGSRIEDCVIVNLTDEEMAQMIADIESGKIMELTLPEGVDALVYQCETYNLEFVLSVPRHAKISTSDF